MYKRQYLQYAYCSGSVLKELFVISIGLPAMPVALRIEFLCCTQTLPRPAVPSYSDILYCLQFTVCEGVSSLNKCRYKHLEGEAPADEDMPKLGQTAANYEVALQASLNKLGVGHVDLYQLHWPDRYTPMARPTSPKLAPNIVNCCIYSLTSFSNPDMLPPLTCVC